MLRLILLLTVVPAIELFILLRVGATLGLTVTLGIILVTGILGARLARREGLGVLAKVQQEMSRGETPTSSLLEGALVVMGGLLLLTPGFVTDALGFSLMFPPTRKRFASVIAREVGQRVKVTTGAPASEPPSNTSPWASPFDEDTP
jgi:UPF0716 protein FxsA